MLNATCKMAEWWIVFPLNTNICQRYLSLQTRESIQATERDIHACSKLYSLDYASIHGKLNSSGVVRLNGADKCMRACASMRDVVLNLNCPRLALLDIRMKEKRFNFENTLCIHIYIYEPFWVKVYGENLDQCAIYFADNQNNFHCFRTSWG